jgi:hypothetical protein
MIALDMSIVTRIAPCFLATLLLPQCRKNPEPRGESARTLEPATSAETKPAAAAVPPAPAAETPFAGQKTDVGSVVETSAYKFSVTRVERCADAPAGEKVPPDRPVRLGVSVDVFSKYDQFFLSARDITLEKAGVVIESELAPKPSAGCSALLPTKKLEHDQNEKGIAVFQVPDESFARGGVVAYKPTRWGGAPRVEIQVADVKSR